MTAFDPKNQTFRVAGYDGRPDIKVSMALIDSQRVRLANICISFGVQLGISILTLVVTLTLLPTYKYKKPLHIINISSLVIAIIRILMLCLYFPGPLAEYYVTWSHDANALTPTDYDVNTAANAFNAVQYMFVEAALMLQSWPMIQTWPSWSVWPVMLLSGALSIATVVVKALWAVHHTWALKGNVLPVALDAVGVAADVLGAVSVFYFCGIFFVHLGLHIYRTRGLLSRPERGLTSLEILAIGNGVLMILPSIFAVLDLVTSIGNNRQLIPFEAGSWVQTLVVCGIPLIGLVAFYRGSTSTPMTSARRVSLLAKTNTKDDSTIHKRKHSNFDGTTIGSRRDTVMSGRWGESPNIGNLWSRRDSATVNAPPEAYAGYGVRGGSHSSSHGPRDPLARLEEGSIDDMLDEIENGSPTGSEIASRLGSEHGLGSHNSSRNASENGSKNGSRKGSQDESLDENHAGNSATRRDSDIIGRPHSPSA